MPTTDLRTTRLDDRLFAGALLAGAGLQLAELLLPRLPLLPWLRPGLSWIVILPFLLDFGVGPAIGLFLCRNLLSMAFGGQPASTFLISSTAGILAIALAGSIGRILSSRGWLGRAGTSVLLASTFNGIQLLLVSVLLVGSTGYFGQIGPLILWSVLSGLFVGWISLPVGHALDWGRFAALSRPSDGRSLGDGSIPASLSAAVAMAASLLVGDWRVLSVLVVVAVAIGRKPALKAVLATWPFLPYLAWFHLQGTPGELVAGEWVTRQGLARFATQVLHLWGFTAFGRILTTRLPWNRLLKIDAPWARGLALALPIVPGLFPASTGAARDWWRQGRKGGFERLFGFLARRLERRTGD